MRALDLAAVNVEGVLRDDRDIDDAVKAIMAVKKEFPLEEPRKYRTVFVIWAGTQQEAMRWCQEHGIRYGRPQSIAFTDVRELQGTEGEFRGGGRPSSFKLVRVGRYRGRPMFNEELQYMVSRGFMPSAGALPGELPGEVEAAAMVKP